MKLKNEKKKIYFNIDLIKVYSILFFLILTWIVAICLLEGNYQFNPVFVIGMVVISFLALCFVYKKLSKKFEKMSNKSTWIFYGCVVIVMVILQYIIGYLVRTDPSWDLGLCIQSAKEILQYGHSTDMAVYYIQAPNNIFITLMLAIVIKFFSFFQLQDVNVATLIANIVLIQLAILLLFKITKSVFNNFTACFTLVIMFLFLPIYPYSTIMYTDTTSMFLPLGFLYCFIKIYQMPNDKKKYIYAAIMGALAFISLSLKVTALIVLIAFVIHEIIQKRLLQMLKIMGVTLITFLVIEVSYTSIIKNTGIMGIPYEDTKQIPFTHFVMMGMYGSGAFSAEEWQFTLKLPDYETRKEANIQKIKERLKSYGTQGYIKFLNKKIKGQTWGSGTYDFESILNSYNVDDNIAHQFLLTNGKYYRIVFYYCQIFHFTMLLGIIVSIGYSIKQGKKENSIISISKLSILGLLIFLLLWETRSRYMLNFIPVYILVFVSGIAYFQKDSKKIFSKLFLKEDDEQEKPLT